MQRPYAYDRPYLESRIAAGHEVYVDGKSYTKADGLPTQAELDTKLRASGLDASCLDAVDPLEPHGEPGNPTPAEAAQSNAEGNGTPATTPASSPGPVGVVTPPAADPLALEFNGRPLSAYVGKTNAQINKMKDVTDADVLNIRAALTAAGK